MGRSGSDGFCVGGRDGILAFEHDVVRHLCCGIVERLRWRGLLTATHEPGDARQTQVALTPEGRAMVESTVPFAERISEQTFGDLNAEERKTVVALLRRLSGLAAS